MKKRKVNLYSFLLLLILFSCSSPKFYNEINYMEKSVKNEITKNKDKSINMSIKNYDINKLVLKKLKNELSKTNHIIFFYSPETSFTSRKTTVIIYDVENEIYYSVENSNEKPKQVKIVDISHNLKDSYYNYIFNNYLDNNCEILKKKSDVKISGVGVYEAVYEINLEHNENKMCVFKNFPFME